MFIGFRHALGIHRRSLPKSTRFFAFSANSAGERDGPEALGASTRRASLLEWCRYPSRAIREGRTTQP